MADTKPKPKTVSQMRQDVASTTIAASKDNAAAFDSKSDKVASPAPTSTVGPTPAPQAVAPVQVAPAADPAAGVKMTGRGFDEPGQRDTASELPSLTDLQGKPKEERYRGRRFSIFNIFGLGRLGCRSITCIGCILPLLLVITILVLVFLKPEPVWGEFKNFLNKDISTQGYTRIQFKELAVDI
jgi:hypothetical protein